MDWLRCEIADGLKALIALRLKNGPPEDTIGKTADIWFKAFSRRLNDESVDVIRVREAFTAIFPLVTEWPAPAQVLAHLPNRPEMLRLSPPELSFEEHEASVARVKGLVAEFVEKVKIKPVDISASRERLRKQRDLLAFVEQEYAKGGV